MAWTIEYYEQADTTQPAEQFEDWLDREHPKLAGKLLEITAALRSAGHRLSGGYIEPCRGYSGPWEIRVIHSQWLGREFFGFDAERIVLLHGYIKRGGQEASKRDLDLAFTYWNDYKQTHKISPAQEEDDEPL
ncbi:MAG TPA: type II toxin-antitoxin system RelE/ParE family toxin [Ktedonobacterales bacterium]|jgi:hypothetical protein